MASFNQGDVAAAVNKIEEYQLAINNLVETEEIPQSVIDLLKFERDKLLENVLKFLESEGHRYIGGVSIKRALLREKILPIDWETGERIN